ncbi:MAG: hypothetical protein ACW99A_03285 [Candidatus Kariarchaeaceae archaeon]|jgi:hypothetical protein
MADVVESLFSVDHSSGFIIHSPEQMEQSKTLADPFTINILQILNSSLKSSVMRSWWSSGAIRQLTYLESTRSIDLKILPLVKLGLVEGTKVSQLPNYPVTKKTFHGIVKTPMTKHSPKEYLRDTYCYKLNTGSIDIIFGLDKNRTLFVPLEDSHIDNIQLLKLILNSRTMVLLSALAKNDNPMHTKEMIECLKKYHGTKEEMGDRFWVIEKTIPKLTKLSFQDNIGTKISSNHEPYKGKWTVVNRDTIEKNGKNVFMLYSLNFDRIRLYLTNSKGIEFIDNKITFESHFPDLLDMDTSNTNTTNDIIQNGIIVNVKT